MKQLFFALLIAFALLCNQKLVAQWANDSLRSVQLTGTVIDAETKMPINNLMLINLRTRQGIFSGATGGFSFKMLHSDTLLISAPGYTNQKICLVTEDYQPVIKKQIALTILKVQLKEVTVFAPRDLEEIQKDIEKLGYQKKDYVIDGADAMQSPITFLYQQFSKRERAKREIAERRNDDRRRELLRELLAKYVANQIIDLDNDKFDNFIDFCNVNDQFLKSASQYEFIMFVKKKFEFYEMIKRYR
ncbi:MAG: hypothetical protein IPO27_15825 [Bacteroidetes bacterium]|nr:hypothetical protein [Bacteroidota bacterium]